MKILSPIKNRKTKNIYGLLIAALPILLISGLLISGLLVSGCSFLDRSAPSGTQQDQYIEAPGNRYFNYTQSLQAKKNGNIKEAVYYLEAAVEQDPESLLLKRELTLLYLYEKKFDNALNMIKQVLQAKPEDMKSLIILGSIEQKLENFEAAADAYEKVIQADPEQEKVYLVLGALYTEMGETEKSLNVYKKAVENFPDSFYCYFFLARAYAEKGDTEEAEKWFKKTLEIDPELIEPRFELL
ncbi:MAG: tetratricopeptide repeat protein, partial [Deltaproteobacteria bacterium]|nr:tetratricopeptide repeat protein [Deltaproteobacteria bacterium]